MTFSQTLFDAFRTYKTKTLISDKTRQLTGDDLLRTSNAVAHHLLALGIKPGDRAGVSLRDQVGALIVFLGLLRVGAVPVFIDFRIKPEQKSKMIETYSLVVMLEEGKSTDYHPRATSYSKDWSREEIDREIFIIQPDNSSGMLTVSSGTTGIPKAYVLGDHALSRRMINTRSYEVNEHTRVLVTMPFAFAAVQHQVFPALLAGVEAYIMPLLYSAPELITTILEKEISGTTIPPAIVHSILEEVGDVSEPIFPNLKLLKCSGAAIHPEKAIQAYHTLTHRFEVCLGASAVGTMTRMQGEDLLTHPDSTGRLTPEVLVETVDAITGETLPIGKPGLLKFTAPDVADEIISAVPTDDTVDSRTCITGDIGYLTDEGFLYVTGRVADVIVRAGVAVSPVEIENTLKFHPDIVDVALVGVKDDRLGHDIAAMVVAPNLTEAQVRQIIMEKIDQDKRPRQIRLISALPYTRNKKLDRKAIRAMFAEE